MRIRKIIFNLFFISLPSIIITLFLLEAGLRAGGHLYFRFRHTKDYARISSGRPLAFNILCTGDSFTEGLGAVSEMSYPGQLERILQAAGYKDIAVINSGECGSSSSSLLKKLKGDIERFHPDMILVMTGMNDDWNLRDSSYFAIRKSGFQQWCGQLRLYKLCRAGWVNIKGKIFLYALLNNIIRIPVSGAINPAAAALVKEGKEALSKGESDLAYEKFKEAADADGDNFDAHFWMALFYRPTGREGLAREEIWKGVYALDEYGMRRNIYHVMNILARLNDGDAELLILREYCQLKFPNDRKLLKAIDAGRVLARDEELLTRILQYDLTEIMKLAQEKGIALVFQTYPRSYRNCNNIIRELAGKHAIPLVDNEPGFSEKIKQGCYQEYFVADGHCNAEGYGLIAENVYSVIKGALFKEPEPQAAIKAA